MKTILLSSQFHLMCLRKSLDRTVPGSLTMAIIFPPLGTKGFFATGAAAVGLGTAFAARGTAPAGSPAVTAL